MRIAVRRIVQGMDPASTDPVPAGPDSQAKTAPSRLGNHEGIF
jgi:hypothetical protein